MARYHQGGHTYGVTIAKCRGTGAPQGLTNTLHGNANRTKSWTCDVGYEQTRQLTHSRRLAAERE